MKDVLGNHLKDLLFHFGSLVEYHPITAKDQSRIHQFGKKVLPRLFLGYALYAGGIWKGDVLIADLEELETMDASEIYSKRLNAKKVIFPKHAREKDWLSMLQGVQSALCFLEPFSNVRQSSQQVHMSKQLNKAESNEDMKTSDKQVRLKEGQQKDNKLDVQLN